MKVQNLFPFIAMVFLAACGTGSPDENPEGNSDTITVDNKVNNAAEGVDPNASIQGSNSNIQSTPTGQENTRLPASEIDSDPGNNPFHRIPQFFVNDFIGNKQDVAYNALAGMQYYEDSRVVVYITDDSEKNAAVVDRISKTVGRAKTSEDLIFTWVKLDGAGKVIAVEKYMSPNLEQRNGKGALTLK